MRIDNGWFSASGAEDDVVVSSRVRLARNLLGIPFPPALSKEEEEQVQREVTEAFEKSKCSFETIYLDRLPPLERKILMEQNIISQDFCVSPNKLVLLGDDGCISAMVNEDDHLRVACMRTGLCLQEIFAAVDDLDGRLEENLHFAASIEWGYLASRLDNTGTGLRASVMLHMPALVTDGTIGWALKRINQMGLQIKGYWGDGDNSLGDMYQISNPLCIGYKEKEILASVGEAARELVEYERKAREEITKSRRIELEDRVHRAFGALKACRLISSKEAITLLSTVRLGISLEMISEPAVEVITSLMIRAQKAHIQKMLDQMDDDTDNKLVDYTRAKLIRHALEGHVREDNNV
jgi:protein arginine kinase